jgi:2',3'-cyclic-nucleotide 2'-phosphodiesterase (5'-nucleotidase family)
VAPAAAAEAGPTGRWADGMADLTLRIVNITDVYKLDNFPSLRTLIIEQRKEVEARGGKCVSVLTGDFLAPYLLSSLDKGKGMMCMLNETPIDMVIFGNHEDDLKHEFVVQRAAEYNGVWINSNMQTHDSFKSGHMVATHIVELGSQDHSRKVGFVGVLSNDPVLYRKNAFGGAKIDCPYETMRLYKAKLETEDKVDLVVPLCHLYVPQDYKTCEEFDFPFVLSGHDHHCVDEVHCGTRILKVRSPLPSLPPIRRLTRSFLHTPLSP